MTNQDDNKSLFPPDEPKAASRFSGFMRRQIAEASGPNGLKLQIDIASENIGKVRREGTKGRTIFLESKWRDFAEEHPDIVEDYYDLEEAFKKSARRYSDAAQLVREDSDLLSNEISTFFDDSDPWKRQVRRVVATFSHHLQELYIDKMDECMQDQIERLEEELSPHKNQIKNELREAQLKIKSLETLVERQTLTINELVRTVNNL